MRQIYYIGGSPCCGKSTIAEMIAEKYRFQYFKVDDFLDAYIAKGVKSGKPFVSKYAGMSLDEIWLRNPGIQHDEELEMYREVFEFVLQDLDHMSGGMPIITEGAAYLPRLMNEIGVEKSNYICVVPTIEFQYEKYAQRPWVMEYLEGCSDTNLAFENWMKRDSLFARSVLKEAAQLGYATLVVDGMKSIDDNCKGVESVFHL